jgi:uncharacterized NAD(P)/FAD-binding protein YdhS
MITTARALLAALLAPIGLACAQAYPASQRATLTQNIAHTKVAITYGRPVAKGRELFGKLVPYDEVWHPGADQATRVSIDKDITIEGKPLKAGDYSLWLIARASAPWTIIFSRTAKAWHRNYPGESNDALRVEVPATTASHVESLTIDFPMVLGDSATMQIHWGTTAVAMRIKAP